ncbi:hypothetical protein [Thermaurantiacus sp.]
MLTEADDYPVHQRPEPIAFAGTDRNFYDRYFFNARSPDGRRFFAAALGVYPHLNLIDAAVALVEAGEARSVFASRVLHHERMQTEVGPIRVEVLKPLRRLRLCLVETDGLALDGAAIGLHPPIEEPRFRRRVHGRTLMDVTRMTQNVAWSGQLVRDGEVLDLDGWTGTRDRSWGVRPIGAADPQPIAPTAPPQFFWLWSPLRFGEVSLFAHTNDDADGVPWNRSAVLVDHASGRATPLVDLRFTLRFRPGTRWAEQVRIEACHPEGPLVAELGVEGRFQMSAIGYGHPTRSHGSFHGEASVATERVALAAVDPSVPANAHVQLLVSAEMRIGASAPVAGRGVFEMLAIGPHRPAGLTGLFDLA